MCFRGKRHQNAVLSNERGVLMLEGMIVVTITIFVLVWLLGLGFVYYQRYTTTVVTNDAAVKIASTYNNPTSDIIMGYVTTEELSNRDLYRNFSTDSGLLAINEDRATAYIRYVLDKANTTGVVQDVDVDLELVTDSLVRRHVKITTTVTYRTPFSEGLEIFGISGTRTYTATAAADCTDMADYISTVGYAEYLGSGKLLQDSGFVSSVIKAINSLIHVYNHAQR